MELCPVLFRLLGNIVKNSEDIYNKVVIDNRNYKFKFDKIFTNKITGIPIMILLIVLIFIFLKLYINHLLMEYIQ